MSRWDKVAGHQRRYLSRDLKGLLLQTGFRIEKISYFNLFALLPAILVRFFKSNLNKRNYSSDFIKLPGWLNQMLIFLTKVEKSVITQINLPAGLSIICLGRKND
jgi:hypothetical protein